MLSYSKIIAQAYGITMDHPLLWVFGLFVIGGFNISFLRFDNIPIQQKSYSGELLEMLVFFQSHPGLLALICLGILVFSLLTLVVTNWSRIVLVLSVESILNKKQLLLGEHLKKSYFSIFPIIKISLITTTLMLFVVAGLLLPPFLWLKNSNMQNILWFMAAVLFLPLAFAMSCINIFTGFFVILFKKKLSVALNLGTDFVLSRWPQILGLVIVLTIIYSASFTIGLGLIYIVKFILNVVFAQLVSSHIIPAVIMITTLKIIFALLLWVLLAGLNVFFNTALLLLFLELVDPIKHNETLTNEVPALSAVP